MIMATTCKMIMATTCLLKMCFIFSLYPLLSHSFFFEMTDFAAETHIFYEGDAEQSQGSIQLTKSQGLFWFHVSHASYRDPVRLWDSSTGKVADFTTRFSFTVTNVTADGFADGFTFFLAPFSDPMPPNSAGGYFGLFNTSLAKKQIVVVEFDSFVNDDDWDSPVTHVGINNGSLYSSAYAGWDVSSASGKEGDAVINYNGTTKNLSVVCTYKDVGVAGNSTSLIIDLRNAIPEWVRMGFSASTGFRTQLNTISSWHFTSNMNSIVVSPSSRKVKRGIRIGGIVSLFVLVLGIMGIIACFVVKRRTGNENGFNSTNADLERGALPVRFSFQELVLATNNFSDDNKLGRGGSGQVYKGVLTNLSRTVAVKRILTQSESSDRIFVNEVKIISRLIHRNLVQFIGFCHDQGNSLLVYDYMPNGSLDTHLFGSRRTLPWPVRRKIAFGLSSALHYLHEDVEQCVLHRDIKSANVLLDTDFSTKLGDFGVAKLVDPGLRTHPTGLVGTLGYLAPEYVSEGRATKESDMFSFGVVALEMVCGRRTYLDADNYHIPLSRWVWELYSCGNIRDAIDERLGVEFDMVEVEQLLMVGLWCTNPNDKERPKARQVIKVLQGEMPIPELNVRYPPPPLAEQESTENTMPSSSLRGASSSNF